MFQYLGLVDLNQINFKRTSLTDRDAVGVWLLSLSGQCQHHIAGAFGTNPGRVADVLNSKTHVGSEAKAREIFFRA